MIRDQICIAGFNSIEAWGRNHLEKLAGQPPADDPYVYMVVELTGQVGSLGECHYPVVCCLNAAAAHAYLDPASEERPHYWLLYCLTRERCAWWDHEHDQFQEDLEAYKQGTLVEKIRQNYASIMAR